MKPMLLLSLIFLSQYCFSQSLDYITVRKKNGTVIKNFYSGSEITLQTIEGRYLQGPISTIRRDSVYIVLYDIRYFPTSFGTYFKDTISVTTAGLKTGEIKRILINKRRNFLQRTVAPIAIVGGAGYFALNLLNGTFFDKEVTTKRKITVAGIAGLSFGVGYLIQKIFSSDGFTKKNHQIRYVDLSVKGL